jgi:hypothetical protein
MKLKRKRRKESALGATRARAIALLRSSRFFCKLLEALAQEGLVGEERNALVIFVVAVSRLLSRPLNLFVKGQSSSGKNHTVRKVLRLIPQKCICEITNSSEKAWNYMGRRLKHRIVFFQEESVAFGGKQHPARLLISENRLERLVTVRRGAQFTTKKQVTEGPVACISTTTRDQLQVDDETRHVSIWADESREQTGRIVRAQLTNAAGLTEEEIRVWHTVQELLAARSSIPIELPPWFVLVANEVWTGDVRIRRYFPAFVEACRTVCLIRSFRDVEKEPKSLKVSFRDYAITTLIFQDAFAKSLNSVDEKNMELRECLSRILSKNNGQPVSAQDIAGELGIPLHQAYEQIRRAVREKLLQRANPPQRGNLKRYLPTETSIQFLPNPEQVFKRIGGAGRRVKFVHPITGKAVIYKT